MSKKKPKNTSIKKMRNQGKGREIKNPVFSAVVYFCPQRGQRCVRLLSVTVINHESSTRFGFYQSLNSEGTGGKTA